MAVTFDAASNSGEVTATSATWSHTITGSNAGIFVGVSWLSGAAPTGVTYNGVALLRVGGDTSTGKKVDLWFWDTAGQGAAPTGSHSVVVTFAASTNFVAGAASFTGVNQGTPTSGFASATGFSASATVNITAAASGDMVVACVTSSGTSTADQTQDWFVFTTNVPAGGSHVAGAGTTTISWTVPNNAWTIGAFDIQGAVADAMEWARPAADRALIPQHYRPTILPVP